MKRLFFPLILFLILVCEGIAIELLPPAFVSSDMFITPHWVFIFLLLMSLFYDKEDTFFAIIYGVIFGLLIDVVYTGILGVYMFVYPFIIYIVHLLKRFLQTNIYMTMIIATVSLFIGELLIFLIFSIVGSADMTINHFLIHRFIPTLIANLLFLIPLYFLSVKKMQHYRKEQLEN